MNAAVWSRVERRSGCMSGIVMSRNGKGVKFDELSEYPALRRELVEQYPPHSIFKTQLRGNNITMEIAADHEPKVSFIYLCDQNH